MTSKYGPETRLEKVNISDLIFKKLNAKKQHKVSIKYEPQRVSYIYTAALPTRFDTESSNCYKFSILSLEKKKKSNIPLTL